MFSKLAVFGCIAASVLAQSNAETGDIAMSNLASLVEQQDTLIKQMSSKLAMQEDQLSVLADKLALLEVDSNVDSDVGNLRRATRTRKLSTKSSKAEYAEQGEVQSRNICYASEDDLEAPITAYVGCLGGSVDEFGAIAGCLNITGFVPDDFFLPPTRRRALTESETASLFDAVEKEDTRNLQAGTGFLCDIVDSTVGVGAIDSAFVSLPAAFYELGAIEMKKQDSLMIELTASTITLDSEIFLKLRNNAMDITSLKGIYVTATMWEDCEDTTCVGQTTEITPEPNAKIPLQVKFDSEFDLTLQIPSSDSGSDDWTILHAGLNYEATLQTNTVKLFFPESKLTPGVPYFITLEISVEVGSTIDTCAYEGLAIAATLAGASLGPHIIDAEIINDGDFGNCSWLDADTNGCGFFDKVSGSKDVECGL